MTQREAYRKAGYSTNMALPVIDVKASQLASNGQLVVRIQELRKKTEDASVMNVLERKQRLSEIARAKMTDFVTVGADGAWFDINKDNVNSAAIQYATSKTVIGKDGADDAVLIRVGLHSPTQAIDLLNKMDKIYEEKSGNTININVDKVLIDARGKLEGAISRLSERTQDA